MLKSYKECKEFKEKHPRKTKLENNTYLEKTEYGYGIRLHNTIIVEHKVNETILNSGGWQTVTTKDRINKYMPYGFFLSQNKGQWFINDYKDFICIFKDDMEFNKLNQKWKGGGNIEDNKDIQKLRKQINDYAKNFTKELFEYKIQKPNNGDCWYCLMFDKDNNIQSGHILSHFKEKYYVPSLLFNAVKMFPISLFAENTLNELWYCTNKNISEWEANISKEQIKNSIKRYCLRKLNLPT